MLHASEGPERRDPFVEFLQGGLPEGPWLQRVIQGGGPRKVDARAALHLHAFYPELVPGIVKRLNFNASFPDLFVSVCTSEGAAEVRKASSEYPGRLCDLQITPNLGRDFGSLLTQFGPTVWPRALRRLRYHRALAHKEERACRRSALCGSLEYIPAGKSDWRRARRRNGRFHPVGDGGSATAAERAATKRPPDHDLVPDGI